MTMWALLGWVSSALAGDGRLLLAPARVETGVAVREGAGPAFVSRVGAQLVRTERWVFEVNGAFLGPRPLYLVGPPRSWIGVEGTADTLFVMNRMVALGPTAGFVYRLWRQQGQLIDDSGTMVVGARANVAVLRTRTWGVGLAARGTVDLDATNLVLEDSRVVLLDRLEGQLVVRVDLGHGRVRGEAVP